MSRFWDSRAGSLAVASIRRCRGQVAVALPLGLGAVAASPASARPALTNAYRVATIRVGATPAGVAVNPRTKRVYVANSADGTVPVINAATGTSALLSESARTRTRWR